MSSPEGTGTFVEATSCSPCPVGTKVSLATSVPNDETSCMLVGIFDKMSDGCKGVISSTRSCYPKKAVDDWIKGGTWKENVVATYGPMNAWDMSEVTDISYLFYNKQTWNADLSNWDVSSVTDMSFGT